MSNAADHDLVAFLDESRRPVCDPATGKVIDQRQQVYVVAAAVAITTGLDGVRAALASIAADVAGPLHFHELTDARRRLAARLVGERLGGSFEAHVAETDGATKSNEHVARAKLLGALLPRLTAAGVGHATLESRDDPSGRVVGLDARDYETASVVKGRGLSVPSIDHGSKAEPLLALPDLFAGARSLHLCNGDSTPWFTLQEHVVASGPIRIRA